MLGCVFGLLCAPKRVWPTAVYAALVLRLLNGHATELQGDASDLERLLQTPIEKNLGMLLASLEDYVFPLGDDVQRKEQKLSIAFKLLKNFATVVPQKGRLLLYLHLDVAKPLIQMAYEGRGSVPAA